MKAELNRSIRVRQWGGGWGGGGALLAASLIGLLPGSLGAQIVEGRLVDRDRGFPRTATYVVLIDPDGREVARTQTDAAGGFVLRATTSGAHRLRAEQIGFEFAESAVIMLDSGKTLAHEFEVSREPVLLSAIDIPNPSSCVANPDQHVSVLTAWREVRKTLSAVRWTASNRSYRYQTLMYERDIAPDTDRIRREQTSIVSDLQATFFAAGDPLQLAAAGYALELDDGSFSYFAPDPVALLHPSFIDTHCFSLTRDSARAAVGVRFAPLPTRTLADISGTMWLDEETARLLEIDYRYTNDPSGAEHEDVGGSITFTPLQEADWMLREWRLRLPMVGASIDSVTGRRALFGFTELGGSVTQVTDMDGTAVFTDESVAVLSGTIFDSTRAMPLSGAVVALAGTEHWATTDDRGEFFFAEALDGDYNLVFGHPRLDSLGFLSPPTVVAFRRGQQSSIRLAVPSLPAIISKRCNGGMESAQRRVLLGIVRDAETKQPAPGVLVSVSWHPIPLNLQEIFDVDDLRASAVTDSVGMYALCGVPLRRRIMVHAAAGTRMSDFVSVVFHDGGVVIDNADLYALDRPVARLDLNLIAPEQRNTELAGVVTDAESGAPLVGALVQVGATAFAIRTDSTGAFRFRGVPPGPHRLAVRHLGYRQLRHDVGVVEGFPMLLPPATLRMQPLGDEVVVLDPIVVEAERMTREMVGFAERQRTGIGSFLTRLEFERWNPTVATDVLRRMRGMRVRPNQRYGFAGDTRRWLIESRRDIGARITRVIPSNGTERSATTLGGGTNAIMITECPVLLFVDGAYVGDSRVTDVDNLVTLMNLTAVEVYTSSQVPARFNLPGATCGVAVFWTR